MFILILGHSNSYVNVFMLTAVSLLFSKTIKSYI